MKVENALFTEEIPEKGIIDGHIQFSLHSITPEDLGVAGPCANLAASLLFEKLGAQGTNIIMLLENETGKIDVVSRNEDDGLGLEWQAIPVDKDKLDDAQRRISDKANLIGEQKPPPEEAAEKEEAPPPEEDDDEDYHSVKQITRVP